MPYELAAVVLGGLTGEVAGLIEGTGVASTIARGALAGISALGADELLHAIQSDLSAGGAAAASARKLAPHYAIVDMQTNTIVKTLSTHRVYVILTHRPRKSRAAKRNRESVIIAPAGSEIVRAR